MGGLQSVGFPGILPVMIATYFTPLPIGWTGWSECGSLHCARSQMRRRHRALPQVACCPHFKYLSLPVVVVVVVVVIMHFAEFGSARLWCFLGEPKAVLNLLPILTRLPTKQDLLFFLLMSFSFIWHIRLWWGRGLFLVGLIFLKLSWIILLISMERLTRAWGEVTRSPFVLTGELEDFALSPWPIALRYARLHRLWLNHGIAEKVTHNTEASPGAYIMLYC